MDIKRVGLVTTGSPFEFVLCWCFTLFRRCMHSSRTPSSSNNQATPFEGGVSSQLMVILIRTPHTIRAAHFLRGLAQQARGHNMGEFAHARLLHARGAIFAKASAQEGSTMVPHTMLCVRCGSCLYNDCALMFLIFIGPGRA